VDAMTSGEAKEMLSRGIPTPMAAALRPRLAALAGRLGAWLCSAKTPSSRKTPRFSDPRTSSTASCGARRKVSASTGHDRSTVQFVQLDDELKCTCAYGTGIEGLPIQPSAWVIY
jgi:hypothetical protein